MTIVIGGSSLSSCAKDDNPAEPEVTLEDALKDGTIVAFTFNLNGEEFYVAFLRVGAMGSGTCAPFCHFLVENLVVWIKMLTFVPLISNLILYGTTTKRNQFHWNLSCNATRH